MRSTLALILVLVLLAVGGALFVYVGQSDAPRTVDGTTAGAAPESEAARKSDEVAALPAAPKEADAALGKAERTTIEAPAPVSAAKAPATATLFGRVIDTGGQPIAGAEVRARTGDFELPEFELARDAKGRPDPSKASTDAQGRFEIAGVKPGSVRISVRAGGYVPLSKAGVGVPTVARHDLGDLALETSVLLEGRVVDSRGVGVEGARLARGNAEGVMFFSAGDDPTQGPPPLAVTAADGSFRIDQLACGPWRLRIASETHPDKTENGVTKRPGERVTGLTFALEDGFEIAGRVTGVPAAQVADASVVAMPQSNPSEVVLLGMDDGPLGENRRRAKVSGDGSFVVKGLRQGAYQLQARVAGGRDAFWPRSASERIEAKSGDRGVLIPWQPASVLAFQVVDAQSKAPIEELQVSATLRSPVMFFDPDQRDARRYENGMVQLDDLRPRDANDRATLDVSATGYQSLHLTEIALTRGASTELGVLELKRATTVDVRVSDAATKAPIENAKVTLRVVEEDSSPGTATFGVRRTVRAAVRDGGDVSFDGQDSSTARTDAAGLARLNSRPGKRGKVSVSIDGYAPYTSEAFEMPAEANVEQQVALDQGGSVEITLLSAAGTPVAGARIEHRAPDEGGDPFAEFGGRFGRGKGAATDPAGKVTISNLAPGVHRFRPAKEGGGAAEGGFMIAMAGMESADASWSEVEIVRGGTATLVLQEPELAEVKGRVREAGAALAGASITLRKRGGEAGFEGMDELPFGGGGTRAKSDGEGRYRFEKVEAGSYELVVRHATRAMAARFKIEVDASGLEYDIELPVSVLEGRVLDAQHKPVAGARVWAERPSNERARVVSIMAASDDGGGMVFDSSSGLDQTRTKTDEQGRYSLRGVESDVDLVVRVDAKDSEPAKSDPVSVALGQTRSGVDIEVNPAGQIKVKVLTAAGKNPSPCMVHAEYDDPLPDGAQVEPKVEFAQSGSVTLKGLRPGRWKLYADPIGFGGDESAPEPERKSVVVVAHETAQVELTAP